jgi:hypothetical protein
MFFGRHSNYININPDNDRLLIHPSSSPSPFIPLHCMVQAAPQRWQDMPSEFVANHDVVIAFEERIFDAVIEDLQMREPTESFAPIHVICLDTKDNPHEAALQGRVALELCWLLEASEGDLVTEAPAIVDAFQEERMTHTPIKVLYQLCYL